ncbi:unnamed protein product [Clonostachys rhizophaga]|uniref:Uncharacterized protein n=1 Tax=Clonostachys rhizophaga TaxID=160324 RepID=A0A9N9VM46_9HYPO|nr:unnamed protein product [Clonostachys rhizophaga]
MTLIRLTDTRSPEQLFSFHESNILGANPSKGAIVRLCLIELQRKHALWLLLSAPFSLSQSTYSLISPDFLKIFPNIKVCCDKLSFEDGTLPSGYEQFLQPLPRDQVDKLLHHTEPWRADGVISDLIIPLPFST